MPIFYKTFSKKGIKLCSTFDAVYADLDRQKEKSPYIF